MKTKYQNEKVYKELNDVSTTKQEQLSNFNQMELGIQAGMNSLNRNNKGKHTSTNSFLHSDTNRTIENSMTGSPRDYLIKTENFEIWHTQSTKCISYHGLPYYSKYNPHNDPSNFYILFDESQGEFVLNNQQDIEYRMETFVGRINSFMNGDVLRKSIRKYSIIKYITWMNYAIIIAYLSMFAFYFFYSMIMMMLGHMLSLSKLNIGIMVLFVINIIIMIILFQVTKVLDEKIASATFRHFQVRKDALISEINEWNLKTFSMINMKAVLVENFDYIHIQTQVHNESYQISKEKN